MEELESENAFTLAKESSKKSQADPLEIRLAEANHTMVTHEETIEDLRSLLDHVEAIAPQLHIKLSHIHLVNDDALSYSYLEGFERMWDHVLVNLHSDLRF